MAASRVVFRGHPVWRGGPCPISLCVRPLSTGPKIPGPQSHYWPGWNVSERIVQMPHTRFMKRIPPQVDRVKKFRTRKERQLVALTKTLVNKRLQEIADEEAKIAGAGDAAEEEDSDVEALPAGEEAPKISLFHRQFRPMPPVDLDDRMLTLVKSIYPVEGDVSSNWASTELTDMHKKFQLLDECAKQFHFIVPNSRLNEMKTVADILDYIRRDYEPLRLLRKLDIDKLPPNVKFQCKDELELYRVDKVNKATWDARMGGT